MPRWLIRAVYAGTLLALVLVSWSWTRWARSRGKVSAPRFRKFSTLSSLLLLSGSVLILVGILLFPGLFSGLHGNEPMFTVFMLGVFAALAGSLLGSWAVESVRDIPTPTAWLLIAVYMVVMSDLEPGSW